MSYMPANASERPDLSKLMQAIYLNEQQVANLMRRIEKREALFSRRYSERNQHLAYNIIKRRKKEYMGDLIQERQRTRSQDSLLTTHGHNQHDNSHYVKSPWQMVNQLYEVSSKMQDGKNDSNLNAIKQARQQIQKKAEQKHKSVNNITTINYIQHYNDDRQAVTGPEMISTLGQMMAKDTKETQQELNGIQKNIPNSGLKMARDFSMKIADRLGFNLGQLLMNEEEKRQISELTERTKKIEELMVGDVKKKFNPTEFRRIMSNSVDVGLLVDVGYKLLSKGLEVHNEKFEQQYQQEQLQNMNNKNASPTIKRKQVYKDDDSSRDEDRGGGKPEAWTLPVRPNFGDYLPNRKGVKLSDFKEGETDMFEMLLYALEQADRSLFVEFRSGQITLAQLIYRTQEMVTGKKVVVLDDVRHLFTNNARVTVDPDLVSAYNENMQEQDLYRTARKRGISIKQLKNSEKIYNMLYRCSKSVFAPPKKRLELAKQELQEKRDGFISHEKQQAQVTANAERLEAARLEKLDKHWNHKWCTHEAHVNNMSLQTNKAKCQSTIDRQVETQIYGRKDFFLPPKLKDKIFEQFQQVYEKEREVFEKDEVKKREERDVVERLEAENKRKMEEREAELDKIRDNHEKKKEAARLKKQLTEKMEAGEEPSGPFLIKKQRSQDKSKTASHKKSTELDMKRNKKTSKNSTEKSSQSKLKIKVIKTSQEKKEQETEITPSQYTDFQSKQNSKHEESSIIHKTASASAILIADEKISGLNEVDQVPHQLVIVEPKVSQEPDMIVISSSRSTQKVDTDSLQDKTATIATPEYVHQGEYLVETHSDQKKVHGAEYVSRVTIVHQNLPYQNSQQAGRISQKNLKLSSRNSSIKKPSTAVTYQLQSSTQKVDSNINNRSHATKRLRGGGFNQMRANRRSLNGLVVEKSSQESINYNSSQLKVPKSVLDFYNQKFGKQQEIYDSMQSASEESPLRFNIINSSESPVNGSQSQLLTASQVVTTQSSVRQQRDLINYQTLKSSGSFVPKGQQRPKQYQLFPHEDVYAISDKKKQKLTAVIPRQRGLRADQLTSVVKHSRGLSEPLGVYVQDPIAICMVQQKTHGSIQSLLDSDQEPKVVSNQNSVREKASSLTEKSRPQSKVSRSTNRPSTGTGFHTHQKTLAASRHSPTSQSGSVLVFGQAPPSTSDRLRHILPIKPSENKTGGNTEVLNYLTGCKMFQPPSSRLTQHNLPTYY